VKIKVNAESEKAEKHEEAPAANDSHDDATRQVERETRAEAVSKSKKDALSVAGEPEEQTTILDYVRSVTPEGLSPLEYVQKLPEDCSDLKDKYLRAVADLENFKKRSLKERSQLLKYRNEELLRDLLPIADNLDRALNASAGADEVSALMEGVSMIAGMLKESFERYGVREIQARGKSFDPNFHEAVGRSPAPGMEPNMVIEELEKGYMYQDRLLRAAKVVVSADIDPHE
jgi:molecular chaperone GrpE